MTAEAVEQTRQRQFATCSSCGEPIDPADRTTSLPAAATRASPSADSHNQICTA